MKKWHWIVLIGLTLATIGGQFIEHHYWWEALPGFFALFGFVGCLAIIFGAKLLGHALVTQKPDYYDRIKQEQDVNTHVH
jgi:hypothetical protein